MPAPAPLTDPVRAALSSTSARASSAAAAAAGAAAGVAGAAGPAREGVAHVLEDLRSDASSVLDQALVRGGAAWDALRGEPVGPPAAHRRWPWAVVAAVAGAAAGVGVAYALARVRTSDAPDAVEPEQVQAVVDRSASPTSAAP